MSFGIHGYITPDEVKDAPTQSQALGLSYTATGYGSKIPTRRMAKIDKRWYRIYCAIYSNIGTCYVIKDRKHYVIRDTDCEVTA